MSLTLSHAVLFLISVKSNFFKIPIAHLKLHCAVEFFTLICKYICTHNNSSLQAVFIVKSAGLAWPALFFKKFHLVILRDFNLC